MNYSRTCCRRIIHSSQTAVERGRNVCHLFVVPYLSLISPRTPFDLVGLSGFLVDKSRAYRVGEHDGKCVTISAKSGQIGFREKKSP